jgi:hypothetical protein
MFHQSNSPWFDLPNNLWWAHVMQFSPVVSYFFSHLVEIILLSTLFWNTLQFRSVVFKLFRFPAHCKTYKNLLAHFVYKITNILTYFKLWTKISIQMRFFSFLKYTLIIFAVHLATSCSSPFENNWFRLFIASDNLNKISAGSKSLLMDFMTSLRSDYSVQC